MKTKSDFKSLRMTVGWRTARRLSWVVALLLWLPAPGRGAFIQSAGLVVMEAEHFETSMAVSGHAWVVTNNVAGFAGPAVMQALPNTGLSITTNIVNTSPMLGYPVVLTNAGEAKLWVRGWGGSSADDSVRVGFDGELLATVSYSQTNTWVWKSASFTVTNAGVHLVNLWMREDGAYVDRLILSLDPAFTPIGEGPAEIPLAVQLLTPTNGTVLPAGPVVSVTAAVANPGNLPTTAQFLVNGALTATDSGAPYGFHWAPALGSYQLQAIVTNNVGAAVTSAPVSVTITAPAAATFRWAGSSGTIYVEGGGTATLTDIKAALPNAPLSLVDSNNAVWFLGANLIVREGSTLLLHGTTLGGDVNELRLKSENAIAPGSYVWVDADYGTLDLNGTKVTSWSVLAAAPDAEFATYKRAFIRARSRLAGFIVQQSRLNVVDSEVAYLGYNFSEGYGLTWQVVSSAAGVRVFGVVGGSYIHDCQLGVAFWAADDVGWDGNEIAANRLYGFLAADAGHQAVLASNNVHDNDYGAVARWASSSQRIYVTGPGTMSLSAIKAAVPSAPLTLVDANNAIWYLAANLFVENGAKLELHGPALGGDVAELRLKSENTSAANAFVEIRADWGWLDIRHTKITSWDSAVNGPDTETKTYRRAYVRARSTLEPDGVTAHESRMDIINSEICYLGSKNTEAYGLTWKVVDTTAQYLPPGSTNTLHDLVKVYGDILNSYIHHNFFGVYTYGHYGGHWATNEVAYNAAYGFDPHDDSDHLVIESNNVHHNGWHGIIASKRCDNGVIRNNISWNNGLDLTDPHGNGIMLHRSCNNWVVENNLSFGNADSGIAIFASDNIVIRNNVCLSNVNAGIRLSVGTENNWIEGNEIGYVHRYGLYVYEGSDPPEDDDVGVNEGRCQGNVFTNNFVYDYTAEAIKLQGSDENLFVGNTFTAAVLTFRFAEGTNNVMRDNSIPANSLVKVTGFATNHSSVTLIGQAPLTLQLNLFGAATFADEAGAVFAFAEHEVPTVVDSSGSFALATAGVIGTNSDMVITRKLYVTPSTGGVLVEPGTWSLSGNYRKEWTAQVSDAAAQITYRVGDLQPGVTYRVSEDGLQINTLTANAAGEITFAATPGTTVVVPYEVVR
jgi:poly(beta-D-mannuronate) C5 epimerase